MQALVWGCLKGLKFVECPNLFVLLVDFRILFNYSFVSKVVIGINNIFERLKTRPPAFEEIDIGFVLD